MSALYTGNGFGLPCIGDPKKVDFDAPEIRKLQQEWPHWILKPIAFKNTTKKIEDKFGKIAKNNIQRMTEVKLKRKILEK